MEINTSASQRPLIRLTVPARALSALPLRSGQEVTAVVQSSESDGSLTLNINGKLLRALSSLQLLQGMSLKLSVEQKNQQLVLRLSPEEQQRLVQQQALRQLLPRQDSLKPLLDNLAKLLPQTAESKSSTRQPAKATGARGDTATGNTPSRPGSAHGEVQKLAVQLLRHCATTQSLGEAKGVQQAISHSGVFLEQQLRAAMVGDFSPDRDVKVQLLRLAAVLRQVIASPADNPTAKKGADTARTMSLNNMESLLQLQKQTEAGLARIQVNQLSHTITPQQGEERPLLIELPVFNLQQQQTELLQLKIQRDKNRSGDSRQDCWSVTLKMSPAEYGEIQSIVTLSGGKVSVTFWCAETNTRELFREKLELLTQSLQEQGLEVARCSAHHGQPTADATDRTDDSLTLIDIKA